MVRLFLVIVPTLGGSYIPRRGVRVHARILLGSRSRIVLRGGVNGCEALFCKIHNAEGVFSVFSCVSDSEIEPLLVASGVGVYLHIELVLGGAHHLGLEEVTTFKDRINEQNVIVVLLGQFLFLTLVFL